jgi:hypothetical protein
VIEQSKRNGGNGQQNENTESREGKLNLEEIENSAKNYCHRMTV